jgi:hypothetical protein
MSDMDYDGDGEGGSRRRRGRGGGGGGRGGRGRGRGNVRPREEEQEDYNQDNNSEAGGGSRYYEDENDGDTQAAKKKKKSSSRDNAYVEEVFDATITPHQNIRVDGHFNQDLVFAKDLTKSELDFASHQCYNYWWLPIPMDYFNAGSQGFSDMKFEQEPDMCRAFMKMYQIMLYAKMIALKKWGECVELVYHLVLGEKRRAGDTENPEFVARLWRLRVPKACNLGEIVEELIHENAKRLFNQEQSGVIHRRNQSGSNGRSQIYASYKPMMAAYKYLTFTEWTRLCHMIYNVRAPSVQNYRDQLFRPVAPIHILSAPNSFYHPCHVSQLLVVLERFRFFKDPPTDVNSRYMRNYIYCRPSAPMSPPPLIPESPAPHHPIEENMAEVMYNLDRPYDNEEGEVMARVVEPSMARQQQQRIQQEQEMTEEQRLICDQRNWTAYIFPHDGQHTWKIIDPEYGPTDFRYKFFPEVLLQETTNSEAKARYLNLYADKNALQYSPWEKVPVPGQNPSAWMNGLPYETQLAIQCLNILPVKSRALEFDEQVNMTPSKHKGFGLDEMIESYKSTVERHKHTLTRTQIQLNGLHDFERKFWHLDAIVPPSTKAVVRHLNAYKAKHGNLSCPVYGFEYNNISPFGNYLVGMTCSFEKDRVDTYHIPLLLMWCCGCGVPMGDKLQLNICKCGPAEAGKSQSIFHAQRLLVPGTYQNETYASAKSTTGQGEDLSDPCRHLIHHEMVITQDEAPPPSLGITKGNISDSSEEASITKYRISEGRLRNKVTVLGDNGVRICKYTDLLCVAAYLYGTNEHMENISGAVGSRFYMSMEANRIRELNGGLTSVMMKENTKAQKAEIELMIQRCQLTHARFFEMCKVILTGIIKPVNMTMGYAWVDSILKIAQKKGVQHTQEPRCLLRVLKLAKILAMIECIFLLFDHPDSIIKDRPWDEKFWKLIEPYLYIKQEHISLAFGMLEQQYENPAQMKVEYAAYRMIKKHDVLYVDPNVIGESKRVQQEYSPVISLYLGMNSTMVVHHHILQFMKDHHMMAVPGLKKLSIGNKGGIPTNPASDPLWLEFVERSIIKSGFLKDRYREGVVTNIVKQLVDLTNPVIKVLSDGYIAIAKRSNDDRPASLLKMSVQEGLQHRHAARKDLLYGRPWSDEAPFLLDVISIKEGTPKDPYLYITPPGYIESQLEQACRSASSYEDFVANGCGELCSSLDSLSFSDPRSIDSTDDEEAEEEDHEDQDRQRRMDDEEEEEAKYSEEEEQEIQSVQQQGRVRVAKIKYASLKECGDDFSAKLRAKEIELSEVERMYLKPSYLPSIQMQEHHKKCGKNKVPYPQGFIEVFPEVAKVYDTSMKESSTYTTDDILNAPPSESKSMEYVSSSSSSSSRVMIVPPKEVDEEKLRKARVLALERYAAAHPIEYFFDSKEECPPPLSLREMVEYKSSSAEQQVIYIDDVKDEHGAIRCPEYLKQAEAKHHKAVEMERVEQQRKLDQAKTQTQEQNRLMRQQYEEQERERIVFPEMSLSVEEIAKIDERINQFVVHVIED